MKKNVYLAALALATLASCSSDDVAVSQEEPIASAESLVPVVLGIGNPTMTVTTRGTGTIGSTEATENRWHYEHLRVLMTQIPDEQPFRAFDFTGIENLGEQYDNTFYSVPDETDDTQSFGQGISLVDHLKAEQMQRYYPQAGSSNFFAYYIDDAIATDENGNPDVEANTAAGDVAPAIHKDGTPDAQFPVEYFYVNFEMDGSQDIMAGMAEEYGTGYTGFSSHSARRGVVPQIKMNHLLTRLVFKVVPGHHTANGMTVNNIAVESPYKGRLAVAYNQTSPLAPGQLIRWSTVDTAEGEAEEVATFNLQQRKAVWYTDGAQGTGSKEALEAFSGVTLSVPDDYEYSTMKEAYTQQLGEALFVRPGQTEYPLSISLGYPVEGLEDVPFEFPITLPESAVFEQGKSYTVTVVVYGLSDIRVNVELSAWQAGEDIILNEDPVEP